MSITNGPDWDHTHFKSGAPVGYWQGKEDQETWGYGVGTDIYVIPKRLTFALFLDYIKSNGLSDIRILELLIEERVGVSAVAVVGGPASGGGIRGRRTFWRRSCEGQKDAAGQQHGGCGTR
jgi:hypothetical protein